MDGPKLNASTFSNLPSRWLGVALVAAGAVSFSLAIVFARAIQGLDALTIAFFRAVAAFIFFSLLALRYPAIVRFGAYRSSIKYLIGLGLALGMTAILYVYAVRTTTAANAVLLNNTSAIYVGLLAPWLLKEARPRFAWVSLMLAMVGMILVVEPTRLHLAPESILGVVAAAISGLTLGFTMLFSRLLGGKVNGLIQGWWGTAIAALIALPGLLRITWTEVVPNLPGLILLGVVSLGLPYLLYFLGLQRVRAQVVSIVALLEPVSGVLIGLFIYREVPGVLGFVGIGLVLLSIFLVTRRRSSAKGLNSR